jgi:hypothetical protein
LRDCFASLFQKRPPCAKQSRAARAQRHFFFAKLFRFRFCEANVCRKTDKKRGAYLGKEKSVTKGKLSFRYQDFLAAFLWRNSRKEKLTKETASAPARRATAFEKAVQNNQFGLCEQCTKHPDKSKFESFLLYLLINLFIYVILI